MEYSIVIPIYKRNEIFEKCLASINQQTCLPKEIIIVDNNQDKNQSNKLIKIINHFSEKVSYKILLLKSPKNSSSIARNIGAKKCNSDLVAFLDSDVVLFKDYYEIILNYFEIHSDLIAIQGLDINLIINDQNFRNLSLLKKSLHFFEQIFETSTVLNREKAYVSPSLAVAHPKVNKEFVVKSQWISTCAGVFRKNLFDRYSFPDNFVTYSNNEYLYFSYNLHKRNEGKMLYISKAKYQDIQTRSGRLSMIPLLYQIEVYDLYIFLKLFDQNFSNILIYLISRIGHFLYNCLRIILKKEFSVNLLFHVFFSIVYPIFHFEEIKNNDLSFYERDFSAH